MLLNKLIINPFFRATTQKKRKLFVMIAYLSILALPKPFNSNKHEQSTP